MSDAYSIVIQWSEKDNCFVASLPEWGNRNTQGNSYEQALENAKQVLSSLVGFSESQGETLPPPQTFQVTAVTG